MFIKVNKIIWLLAPLVVGACVPIPIPRENIIGEDRARFWQEGYDAIEPGETTRAQVVERLRKPNAEWVEARTLIYYAGSAGGTNVAWCFPYADCGVERYISPKRVVILLRLSEAGIVTSKDWTNSPRDVDQYGQFLREWIAPDAPRPAIPTIAIPVVFQHLRIDQTRQKAEGSFRYKSATFETGGRFNIISSAAELLDGEDGANGWMTLELEPGTHYLDFYLDYFQGRFRIDIPKGADIVYAGSISTDRKYRDVNAFTELSDTDPVISVSDELADSETLLRRAFPRAENIRNSIFQLHDGPILLYEPVPNASSRAINLADQYQSGRSGLPGLSARMRLYKTKPPGGVFVRRLVR